MYLKKSIQWALISGLSIFIFACSKPAEETESTTEAGVSTEEAAPVEETQPVAEEKEMPEVPLVLESIEQRASYGIGYQVGNNIMSQGNLEVDTEALKAGLEDALAQTNPRISPEKIQSAFGELQQRAAAQANAEGAVNKEAAEAFLKENGQRAEVTTTESGLQYEVLRASEAPEAAKPTPGDTVKVHYHGTLIDGTVFDSSIQRGEPISFPVTGVIPGWVEALQLMSVGDKWKLFIHPDLAYGPRASGRIPANSALIFEVELLGINEE